MAIDRRPPRPASAAEALRCRGRRRASLLPWLGVACLAGALLLLAAPGQALALTAAALLLLLLGREAAVPGGLLLGGDPFLLAAQLVLLDAGVLLALAPRLAGPQPPALVAAAARRRNGARRPTSVLGLYRRALIPFAFQGPLVATLMGEAARLPARRLLLAVLAAAVTATAAWTAFYMAAVWALGAPALQAGLVVAVPLALLGLGVSVAGLRATRATAMRS